MSDVTVKRWSGYDPYAHRRVDLVRASDYDARLSAWALVTQKHEDLKVKYDAKCAELAATEQYKRAIHDLTIEVQLLIEERRRLQAELADYAEGHIKQGSEITLLTIECDALRAEVERRTDELQRANGTASLAIKHRDAAEAEVERLRAAIKLVGADELAFFSGDGTLCVNCNDTFAYATADCEELPLDKISEVVELESKFGYSGIVAWIAHRRNCEPIKERRTGSYIDARAALASDTGGK